MAISVSGIAVPTAASRLPTRSLAEPEPVPDPLDRVREQEGAGQDHRETRDQIDEVQLNGCPSACLRGTRISTK
jgi:hypothetical protein